jgi:hypothetical protein
MADYATLTEVRAMDGLADASLYPDEVLTEAIAFAEELIDFYTGTSWVHRPFTVTFEGHGSSSVTLRDDQGRMVLFPRTITSATQDGVAQTTTDWALYHDAHLVRGSGIFLGTIVIEGTAGITAEPPHDIRWCARTIARQYAFDHFSRIPDRALQVQSEFGNIQLAQASTHPDRPTSMPEVNARLARRRQLPPSAY